MIGPQFLLATAVRHVRSDGGVFLVTSGKILGNQHDFPLTVAVAHLGRVGGNASARRRIGTPLVRCDRHRPHHRESGRDQSRGRDRERRATTRVCTVNSAGCGMKFFM